MQFDYPIFSAMLSKTRNPLQECMVIVLLGLLINGCTERNADTPDDALARIQKTEKFPPLHFTDVTATTGIDLVTTSGQSPPTQILEVKGGGVGLIDFDDDGDLDVFFANGATLETPDAGPGCRLYENLGQLKFQDITDQAGITLRQWAMGITVGDYDGDGLDDIYVTCFGPNVLLKNNGDGTFSDVTIHAGVGDPRWGTGASFGDIDGDGDLDLYIANFIDFDPANPPPPSLFKGIPVLAGPHGLLAQADVLYENLGNGTFRDSTASSGCAAVKPSYGLGTLILDFDLDGDQDIFVGNDSMPNFLFINQGGLKFENHALTLGIACNINGANQATMGIGIADLDLNGRPDIFTTNFSSDTNTLHINTDSGFFMDRTSSHGLGMNSRPYLGWACGFFDFDHDSDEDLLVMNGHVYPQALSEGAIDSTYEQPALLYEWKIDQPRRFRFHRVTDGTAGACIDDPRPARGAAFGDLDGDGDIDVVTTGVNSAVRVIRNDRNGGDWLIVQLKDRRSGSKNPRGIGAKVMLTLVDTTLSRWIFSGGSFESANAQYAHFGLTHFVGGNLRLTLTVHWPDGFEQIVVDPSIRSLLTIERTDSDSVETDG